MLTSLFRQATETIPLTEFKVMGRQLVFKEMEDKATNGRIAAIEAFRRLYYHVYSNSDASRGERVFEDIGKLLLLKLLSERDSTIRLEEFLEGRLSANKHLLGPLSTQFPDLITSRDKFTLSDDLLRQGLSDLDDVNFLEAPATTLGDAFQALIGPRLRGDKGQFFTPRSLVRAMVKIAQPSASDKVVDPAAGTGGFLVETHAYRKQNYPRHRKFGPLVGIEKDRDIQRLGGALVTIATDGLGAIRLANSLDIAKLSGSANPFEADVILTNPPFGARIGITDPGILRQFDLGFAWTYSTTDDVWYRQKTVRTSQDPQILFLELCLKLLKPGGLCGIVLPEGVFGNRKSGYVWDYVRSIGEIEAMLDCPRTTFQPGTDTKTNVLFVRKHTKEPSDKNDKVHVAVAKHCGHDRRGRTSTTNGTPVVDDFLPIGDGYHIRDESCWTQCDFNDKYYLVPRYYSHKAQKAVEQDAKVWNGRLVSFGELVRNEAIVVRKGHEVGADVYGTGEIPFVRTSDISNLEVSVNATNGVSEEVYEQYRESQSLVAGDILLVVDGRYKIGRTAILHENNCRCVVQSHIRVITTTKKSPLNSYELFYLLNTPSVLEEMRNLVFIQSTLGSMGKRLGKLLLPIPKKTTKWKRTIDEFQDVIDTRARLLDDVRQFQAPEAEL